MKFTELYSKKLVTCRVFLNGNAWTGIERYVKSSFNIFNRLLVPIFVIIVLHIGLVQRSLIALVRFIPVACGYLKQNICASYEHFFSSILYPSSTNRIALYFHFLNLISWHIHTHVRNTCYYPRNQRTDDGCHKT